MSPDFRRHDYFLGRRNAQNFFRNYLVLPECNPLFASWRDEEKAAFYVRDATGWPVERPCNGASQRLLPIIPLVGEAATECAALP